jgi:hypothetical protein
VFLDLEIESWAGVAAPEGCIAVDVRAERADAKNFAEGIQRQHSAPEIIGAEFACARFEFATMKQAASHAICRKAVER